MSGSFHSNAHADLMAKADVILARIAHPRRRQVLEVIAPLTRSLSGFTRTTTRVPPSRITDDGTPFEFSLRFVGEQTHFRLLWEPQGHSGHASPDALWAAGEHVNRLAAVLPGIDMTLFEKVRDLFEPPDDAKAEFAMWHALSFDHDGRFLLKTYLNPAVHGTPLDSSIRALEHLGQGGMADLVATIARKRPRTTVRYFSVDLASPEAARTKVYLAHTGTTLTDLEDELSRVPGYGRGTATAAVERLSGHEGAFEDLPILTCLAARAGNERPALTLHFPVRRYTAHDREVLARLAPFVPPAQRSLLERVLRDDLEMTASDERRFVSYVSMQCGDASRGLTVYLQPHFVETRTAVPSARATGT
ncbi:MAG: hypothetical protein HOW73_09000 [Polyangiaceae bacterium]|nr:hypothetical protein [Polyangiaceae bacterium]